MTFMSWQRAAVPLNTRLAIVRVVSVPHSMIDSGTPGMRFAQQFAVVGCVYTTALRRFCSSLTRPDPRAPRPFLPLLRRRPAPPPLRVASGDAAFLKGGVVY